MSHDFIKGLVTLSLLGGASVGMAQTGNGPMAPVAIPAPLVKGMPTARIFYTSQRDFLADAAFKVGSKLWRNADTVALTPQLREVFQANAPASKINGFNQIQIYYQSPQYATHLQNQQGRLSTEVADKFPKGFNELRLKVTRERDWSFYRSQSVFEQRPQNFGTTFRGRYNLRRSWKSPDSVFRMSSPLYTPIYPYLAYDYLAQSGLEPSRAIGVGAAQHPLTRLQVAERIVPLIGDIVPPPVSDQQSALFDLHSELAPELYALKTRQQPNRPPLLGKSWQPPYEYLDVEFSYGKGVSPKLVAKVKAIIAAYAALQMKANPK